MLAKLQLSYWTCINVINFEVANQMTLNICFIGYRLAKSLFAVNYTCSALVCPSAVSMVTERSAVTLVADENMTFMP